MNNLSQNDFPHFLLTQASAGTGKTYELSKRIASFLLFDIKHNALRNILAITFTVNASAEMKQRVMLWLKRLALKDAEALKQFDIPAGLQSQISQKAQMLLTEILFSFKDFQIKTIDSFLTSVFKACAVDFGEPEDFEVVLNNKEYMKTAFDVYLSSIDDSSDMFFRMLDLINETEGSFSFRPHAKIFKTLRNLYIKEKHHLSRFSNKNYVKEFDETIGQLKELAKKIQDCIETNSVKVNGQCTLERMLKDLDNADFEQLFKRGDKTSPILKEDKDKSWANELLGHWDEFLEYRLKALELYSERYYYPYIEVLRAFSESLDRVKKSNEVIFIEDIPSKILSNISQVNIPDVYIRLGGRLYHYYIDEFQDTSPIQYANLEPFLDNSLSQGGSLFIVGDTKQAIYGFRDTDYEIMSRLAKSNPFASVKDRYFVTTLDKNYRSGEIILRFAKSVFDSAKANTNYSKYGDSGLFDFKVEFKEQSKGKGYVLSKVLERPKEDGYQIEQKAILDIIKDLLNRGYRYSDIAVLAHKNNHIVDVSSWLSDEGLPFISLSSLDIRNRKVIKEILWLLTFLDSPSDNVSFASFLLGEIFARACPSLKPDEFVFRHKKERFLYVKFKEQYPEIWYRHFEEAFNNVGYLPVYELLCFLIRVFEINANFAEESGAIAKLLEILKNLETEGKNSLKDFLQFIDLQDEDEDEPNSTFELPIPQNADAIRLMTVHKAKGLGFPAVIYLLYPLAKKRTQSLKVYETKDGLKALKITKDTSKGKLKEIYEHLEKKEKINDLNSLYVGLTRAMDELYLIAVASQNDQGQAKKEFPIDLLIEGEFGAKSSKHPYPITQPENIKLTFNSKPMIHDKTLAELAYDEKQRGEAIHLILSRIATLIGLDKEAITLQIRQAVKYCKLHYPMIDEEEYVSKVEEFLKVSSIKAFFEYPKHKVLVEHEFIDANANLIRIDRLIVDDAKVIIIDFKTGQYDEAYTMQISNYAKVLRDIYKGIPLECYLIYFDLCEVVLIETTNTDKPK